MHTHHHPPVLTRLFTAALVVCGLTASSLAYSVTVGATSATPGYSARDIQIQSGYQAPSGVYWIDPDLTGGNAPFQIYASMDVAGGGWTLAHDRLNVLPDLDNISAASGINIFAVTQAADIRLVDANGLDAYFHGYYFSNLPSTGWSLISGNAGMLTSLYNRPWTFIDFTQYSIFVRETTTVAYPALVPEADTYALILAGLGLLSWRAWRRG